MDARLAAVLGLCVVRRLVSDRRTLVLANVAKGTRDHPFIHDIYERLCCDPWPCAWWDDSADEWQPFESSDDDGTDDEPTLVLVEAVIFDDDDGIARRGLGGE